MLPGFSHLSSRRRMRQLQEQQHSLTDSEEAPTPTQQSRSSNVSRHYHHHHHHYHHYRSRARNQSMAQDSEAHMQQQHQATSVSLDDDSRVDRESSYRTRLPMILQRRRANTNAHRVAIEARGRLDERLREVALPSRRNVDPSLPRLAQYYFNFLFAEDDAISWEGEEDRELEASLNDWLRGSEWISPSSSSSAAAAASSSTSQGMSLEAVDALPKHIYGQTPLLTTAAAEVDECCVCLEAFVMGEVLLNLPCNHKFHSKCLTPWLTNHVQCPYCRTKIVKSSMRESQKRRRHENGDLLSWLEAFETGMSLS